MSSKTSTIIAVAALVLVIFASLQLSLLNSQISELRVSISRELRELSYLKGEVAALSTVTQTLVVIHTTRVEVVGDEGWVTAVYEMVKDSVVMISVVRPVGETIGSGFVYDTQGHIVTNNHVVENGVRFSVRFLDGTTVRARLVGGDPDTDLAVLKIDVEGMTLKPLKLGNSSLVKIGEPIIAVGNPFELTGSVTSGIVSQKGRLIPTARGYYIPGVIQTDAAINPGNSGGPLLNSRGEVIGVTTAIESITGQFAGIGYAIASNIVARVVPVLIEKGRYTHSYLGIGGTEINSELAEVLGLPVKRGFLVENVVPNGPADRAGIRGGSRTLTIDSRRSVVVGGDVIVDMDGYPVRGLDDILTYLVEKTNPGDVVKITVIRGSETLQIDVVLGERP